MIKGAIFDLDGTILDSMGIWQKVDEDFFARRGMPVPDGYTQKVKHMTMPQCALYTKELACLPESVDEICREWHDMTLQEYSLRVKAKPGAAQYISRLKSEGIKIGVATVITEELYRPALIRNGLYAMFDAFANTHEVIRGKGYPDVYLLAAERMDVKASECVVFEDILTGIRGAKSGGFFTVGVYDRSSHSDSAEIKREADGYISDFENAVNILETDFQTRRR